jgi:hypothetical protein
MERIDTESVTTINQERKLRHGDGKNWRLMRWPGVSLATMTRSIRAVITLHLWATATENYYGREPQ